MTPAHEGPLTARASLLHKGQLLRGRASLADLERGRPPTDYSSSVQMAISDSACSISAPPPPT